MPTLCLPTHARLMAKDRAAQCKCMESGIHQLHVEDWRQ